MNGPTRVLLVDDDPDWLRVTADLLEYRDDSLAVEPVVDGRAALERIEAASATDPPFDCIVSDYHMAEFDGLQLLERVRERFDFLPFILVTGAGDERIASEAIRRGVTDYVLKDGFDTMETTLINRITNAVENWHTARVLEASRERFSALFAEVPDPVAITDGTGTVQSVNRAFAETFDVSQPSTAGGGFESAGDRLEAGDDRLEAGDDRPQHGDDWIEGDDDQLEADGVRLEDDLGLLEGLGGRLDDLIDEVERLPDEWNGVGGSAEDGQLVRYRTADGDGIFLTRRFELETGSGLHCWIYTDVTAQIERERAVRRERDVTEAVRDVLVSSSSRSEIERGFCERVARHRDLALVWIGEPTETELVPRTAVGATEYLDRVDLALRDDAGGGEPGIRAIRDDEIVVVEDVSGQGVCGQGVSEQVVDGTGAGGDWAETAEACGFAGVVAVPLTYRGVTYGVLAAYADRPGTIDRSQVKLLEDLSRTVAYAINAATRTEALLTDEVVEFRLVVESERYPLVQLARSDAFERLEGSLLVEGIVPDADGRMMKFASAEIAADEDPTSIAGALEAATDGISIAHVGTAAGRERFRLSIESPSLGSILAAHGAAVDTIEVGPDGAVATATLSRRSDLRVVYEAVSDHFPGSKLRSQHRRTLSTTARDDALDGVALTDRQRQVLETAYHGGFFERPKRTNADVLADSLDISRSTFLQHLRVAQSKVFATLIDRDPPAARGR